MFRIVRLALAAILTLTLAAAAQNQVRDRIVQAVDDQNMKVVRGNIHGLARAEFDRGRMDPATRIEGVTLAFRPSAAQQKDLDKLLVDLQDPKSPVYHQWLTPEEFGARFGMSDSDLAQVQSWLESKGFSVIDVPPSRNRIRFSGTVAQIESAFRMEMHRYRVKGEDDFANATEPSMPAAFASLVAGLNNLHTFRPEARAKLLDLSPKAQAHFTSGVSGSNFIAPGDFAVIYNLNPLYNHAPVKFDGTGQTIAVAGQTALASSSTNDFVDVNAFRAAAGLAAKQPTLTLVPNSGSRVLVSSDLTEADLDVQWSGAVAKNATINYVYVGNNQNFSVWDSIQYAVTQKIGVVISTSYGFCETQQTPGFITQFDSVIAQANAQGQTITAATGDSGAADCDGGTATAASNGIAVDHPASSPGVTGLGGTEFSGDNPSPTGFWTPVIPPAADIITSALQYIPETTWNDTALSGSLDATGGGTSVKYSQPSWQALVGVPLDGARHVPDISLDSSNGHDPYLICSAGSCTSGFRTGAGGNLTAVGGTSVASPTFAGIVAILNQATGSTGLGNINPTLYTLAATAPNSFHDITTGNNIVPCVSGSLNCPASAPFQFGYRANACYDQVTGIGTIDANNLATNWTTAATAASYTISASPASQSVSAKGQPASTTLTINSVNNFAGTVNLACTAPGGSSEVTCSVTPPAVTLTAGGSATATLNVTTQAPVAKLKGIAPRDEIRFAAAPRIQNAPENKGRNRMAWLALGGSLVAGFFLFGKQPRRKLPGALFVIALGAFALTSMSCGGGSSPPPPVGIASFSATSLAFGSVTLNTPSTAASITLTNVGTAALSVGAVTSSSAQFAIASNTCGVSLPASSSCAVSVVFTPTASGAVNATLNFPNGDSTAAQSFPMSGTGMTNVGTPTGTYNIPVAATTPLSACAQKGTIFTVTVP